MVTANCGFCKGQEFGYKTVHIGPKYVTLVHCTKCGAVVGTVDEI